MDHCDSTAYSHAAAVLCPLSGCVHVRLAVRVLQVLSATKFVRPIYAGNGLATVSVAPEFQKLIMATVSDNTQHCRCMNAVVVGCSLTGV
jgi:hypothetical protein